MEESIELQYVFGLLQIFGIFAAFICCFACLYYKAKKDHENKVRDEKIYGNSNKDLRSRVEHLENKIQRLERNNHAVIV